ncbi:uncharacterized protein [Aegilops tauschii subsp. strangulata]|uniref:N-acetyltransferase domain-containing protein n=2 Tax=Triticinae TaxID=1648030 RepID=A0A453M1Q0_AEGTS|nr:uncharacterized protein LOC109768722 [Aegilops tauschii subsp. strangulata]XP_044399569.1 uncharacterized protein LOC123123167 [Triticum aestivum]
MATEVTLRRFDLSDVDAMMAWASDPEVAAFCRWAPFASTETEALLAHIRDTALSHQWYRAICLAGDARPVGSVSLEPTADPCRGELGYVVARAHWGRGVATAAVRAALAAVFGEVEGLARVEALVDVDNAASQRVAEKAGFRREGVLRRHYWHKGRVRDLVVYGFVSGDPLPPSHEDEARRSMEREAAARTPERADEVTLRPFDLADAMTAWAEHPVLVPPTASMASGVYFSPPRDALLAFLRGTDPPHTWIRAVCLGGAIVGAVTVSRTEDRCRAEVGTALARAHRGTGVAAAALRRAATAALGDLEGVERVEALVDADDAASRRAVEDAGFRREAVLRSHRDAKDVVVYSLISTDDDPLIGLRSS